MSKNEAESCSFCTKTENEVILIDMNQNSLLIDDEQFDFPHIFEDLFQLTVRLHEFIYLHQ